MKKKIRKKKGKNWIKKKKKSSSILPVLFAIALLSLFSETTRTIPAGAFSELNQPNYYNVPKLNPEFIETKYLKKQKFLIKQKNKELNNNQIIFVAKAFESEAGVLDLLGETSKKNKEILTKDITDPKIDINVPKIKKKIKLAADTSSKTITIDGEEKVIAGSFDKNITYMQILQKPNDLDLNLKYAQQQGKIGNHKQTIATLERLNMIYPDNIEIKLYLLSVLVQADSPDKALTIIEELKKNEDITPEDLATINEIEEEMKSRKGPKLWNFYADISIGGTQNNNVNSVPTRNLQISSDEISTLNSAKFDRTYTGGLGFTATRAVGEASTFSTNLQVTDSDQVEETGDDFQSYGFTVAYDTTIGNQNLSPYITTSKTDYQEDADSFGFMWGIGGSFSVGEEQQHSLSYGYGFTDAKGNNNTSDTTADDTNSISHSYTLGHDFTLNDLISTSIGLGYADSDAKDDTNDYETYDLSFRVNLAFPWAYVSIGDALSWNDYKRVDTSTNSGHLRSDVVNTFDFTFSKALGDFFPFIDRSKSIIMNFYYEKSISESNIITNDYISDSFSIGFTKSLHLNK